MSESIVDVPTNNPDLTGFTYVKRRSRKPQNHKSQSRKNAVPSSASHKKGNEVSETPMDQIKQKFQTRQEILLKSQFFKDFQQVFRTLLDTPEFTVPKGLKMLGIGTLTHNPSLTQLSFGIRLAEMLGIPLDQVRTSDPMYTATDCLFLKELGLCVQSVNEGNMHETNQPVLIFAPHVPKSVYEAILRAHWDPEHMASLVLLGNDLRHYPHIYSDEKLRRESPAILAIGSTLESLSVPGNFEYNNVFNDLAIQWFKHGQTLPNVQFDGCDIETENFEINQDEVAQKRRETSVNEAGK